MEIFISCGCGVSGEENPKDESWICRDLDKHRNRPVLRFWATEYEKPELIDIPGDKGMSQIEI